MQKNLKIASATPLIGRVTLGLLFSWTEEFIYFILCILLIQKPTRLLCEQTMNKCQGIKLT